MKSILQPQSILLIRPDRIGDVVLSTPVMTEIRRVFPNAKLSLLVREPVAPLLRGLMGISDIIFYEPTGIHQGWAGLKKLSREIKKRSFDIALTLQSQCFVAAAVWFAGVPLRVGPRSKIHSYVFYNRGVRQKRSQSLKHEADYNLDLLTSLGIEVNQTPRTSIVVSDESRLRMKQWLKDQGISFSDQKPIAIHPGMGGSALNWKWDNYGELLSQFEKMNLPVVVTSGPLDREQIAQLKTQCPELRGKRSYFGGAGESIGELAALFQNMALVVAPSTGPLHIAVALGIPVVSIFSPIRVQGVRRWGPYGTETNKALVFSPEVKCPARHTCQLERCSFYPCMDTLEVDAVRQGVFDLLRKNNA